MPEKQANCRYARRPVDIEPFRVVEILQRATALAARHLRFAYTTSMDQLEQAVDRQAGVLGNHG